MLKAFWCLKPKVKKFIYYTQDTRTLEGPVYTPVRLLYSSGGGCGLASSLGGQLLARGLSTCGLAGCLLGTGHGC